LTVAPATGSRVGLWGVGFCGCLCVGAVFDDVFSFFRLFSLAFFIFFVVAHVKTAFILRGCFVDLFHKPQLFIR
jgi:hypothetical protein